MIGNEKIVDRITVDLYNKKVILRSEDDSVVTLRCSTINELVELLEKCKSLLNTDNVIYR